MIDSHCRHQHPMHAKTIETLTDQAFMRAPTAIAAQLCLVSFHDSPQNSLRCFGVPFDVRQDTPPTSHMLVSNLNGRCVLLSCCSSTPLKCIDDFVWHQTFFKGFATNEGRANHTQMPRIIINRYSAEIC